MNMLDYLAYVLIACLGLVLVIGGIVGITVAAGMLIDRRTGTEEAPPEPSHPLDLPTPSTTERLRIWSVDFDLIEELPANAKRLDEGLVTIYVGSPAHQYIVKLKGLHKDPVYLTVDSANGRWCGRLFSTHWSSHNLITFAAQFEPDCLLPGYSMAGWSE